MPGGRRLGSNKLQMLFYTKNLIRTVLFEIVAKKCIRINSTFANGFNAEKNIYLLLVKWHKNILVVIITTRLKTD